MAEVKPSDFVGKTIATIDVHESVTIRFTDDTHLEFEPDTVVELNGDVYAIVKTWSGGVRVEHGYGPSL